MMYQSADGMLRSSDADAVRRWDARVAQAATDRAAWTARLRELGVKAAHPDDGWVHRHNDTFTFSWYPQFNDDPQIGDLIAFGWPPRTVNGRQLDGYRLVEVTAIDGSPIHRVYHFVDTGRRLPPPPRRWWARWRR